MTHNFTELEQNLGFSLTNSTLLTTALTHRSYLNENSQVTEDNERLEFLGDAVLDLIVANYLYRTYPTMPEGEMTALRAALVRAESLAAFAKLLTIDQLLLLGLGEEDNGGRQRIPTLCAAFEAVMGAIYLEKGFAPVQNLLERLIAPALSHILENSLHKDARSEFQIWAQAQLNQTPRYEVVKVEGPDHARQFTVQVKVNDQVWGEGSGRSKQVASQAAAAVALKQIQEAR